MVEQESIILIVDDQLSAREVLRGLLNGQSYRLTFAGNGEEALNKAAELTPDLILLDVMMPDMDGFEVCRQIRVDPLLAEIPIVMVTALDDFGSRVRGIEAGADDFVTKPFNGVELLARVRTTTRLNRYRRLLTERTYRQQAEAEIERRNWELSLLNHVITSVASTLDVEEALYVACEALTQAFELPQATALLFNQDQTEFDVEVNYHSSKFRFEDATPAEADGSEPENLFHNEIPIVGLVSEILSETKSPLAIGSELTDPRLTEICGLMHEHRLGSVLIIPILMGDETAGFIEMTGAERRSFSKQELILAQSVGAAVGQAMETALLYQNLQHHADHLEEMVAQRTEELQHERDRTQAILETLGEAVVVTTMDGTVEYFNPAAAALIGLSEAEAVGQNWRWWQRSKGRKDENEGADDHLFEEILTAVDSGQMWQGEVDIRNKDGGFCEALLTVAPLANQADPTEAVGLVSVFRDITLLKEAERLREIHQEQEKQTALNRLRHTFLSSVNHELRTPLALIFQTIEMLEDDDFLGPLTEQQADAVMAIRRQAWALGRMVENLTRVAAFLSKQERVRPVLAQLEPVFNNTLPLIEFRARSKEIEIETDIAADLPSLPLDVKQMEEALIQLLENAIKFNQPGGKVTVSARADEDWVIVSVADTGIGIEPGQLVKIWDAFEQNSDPLRRAQEGLGLGLGLARHIVEAHHGNIEIETTPGEGSTFTVSLPRNNSAKGLPG